MTQECNSFLQITTIFYKLQLFSANHNYFLQTAIFFTNHNYFYVLQLFFREITTIFYNLATFFYNRATFFYKPQFFSTNHDYFIQFCNFFYDFSTFSNKYCNLILQRHRNFVITTRITENCNLKPQLSQLQNDTVV